MRRAALVLGLCAGACFDKPGSPHLPDGAQPDTDTPGSATSPVAGREVDPSPVDHDLEIIVMASCFVVVLGPIGHRHRRSRADRAS
jgi:hypothetical protein